MLNTQVKVIIIKEKFNKLPIEMVSYYLLQCAFIP